MDFYAHTCEPIHVCASMYAHKEKGKMNINADYIISIFLTDLTIYFNQLYYFKGSVSSVMM